MLESLELINAYNMTDSQINTWLRLLKDQNINHFIYRLNAFSEFQTETSKGIQPFNKMLTFANAQGIDVSLDLHTWFTTWDNYFIKSDTYRNNHLNYIKNVLNSVNPNYKTVMVLNEAQATKATEIGNNFILNCIAIAKQNTSKPVSVRFMGGYSPTTGHYSPEIDYQCDFISRNTYLDPRTNQAKYGSTIPILKTAIESAHNQGKQFWFTEFGYPKTNLSDQAAYVQAFLNWANALQVDACFAWTAQPSVSGETYNLFNGLTPNPAFYALTNNQNNQGGEVPSMNAQEYRNEVWEIGTHSREGTTSQFETIDNVQAIAFNAGQKTRTNLTEINSKWLPVNQGDTIICRAWTKSEQLNQQYKYGLIAGFDLYGTTSRLFETPMLNWVPYGTTEWSLSESKYTVNDSRVIGFIAFLGANFRFNSDGSPRTWGEIVPAKHWFVPQICIVPNGAVEPVLITKPTIQTEPEPQPQPTKRTLAARVPMVGNSMIVQYYLRKLRDKAFSKEMHKKLHPII